MPTLIPSSYFVHDAMQICLWFVFLGLAVATHTAQSDEGEFAMEKNTATNQFAGPDTNWQPSYRLNTANVMLNRSKDAAPSGTGFSSTPRLSLLAEPKKEDDWSVNIQKQIPTSSNCSSLSSLMCLDSKDEGPDNKPQQDSFWFVLRKAFHF
jgi:hypothetical protein